MKKIVTCLGLLFLAATQGTFAAGNISVYSPNKQIVLRISNTRDTLRYTVLFRNKTAVKTSPLMMTVDGNPITVGTRIAKTENYTINETYPVYGAHALAVNHCNGARIRLVNGRRTFVLNVRVFNDAAAFRFEAGADHKPHIPDEISQFNIPKGSTIWYHDLTGHYEGVHVKKTIDSVKQGEWVAPPATIKLADNAGYMAITEADLKDYPGMALQANGVNQLVLRLANHHPISHPYELRYSKEDIERVSKPAVINGNIVTPWRVVMIGADLNTLVNCDAVTNLCPAPDPKYFPRGLHTLWVKPGRAVWQYLDGAGDKTLANMKEYSRLAGELGFEHNILEGFWEKWSDDDLRELVNYSRPKRVDIWVWMHSKRLRDTSVRHALFKRCHDLGIAGLKIDFFDNEAKEVVDLYQAILRETAALHLMVDFHGANKPTGQMRTWPNELTREAVKGMESSKLEDRATHSTTLPFTRLLAGPAEYTPVHFGERRKNTTWTNQIASAVILSAPMLTYAASPQNMLDNPGVDMIKSIPSVWDETIVLPQSAIGELAVFARRKGDTWFLAVMNGTAPRQISIPLSFLKSAATALSLSDSDGNPASLVKESSVKKPADVIRLNIQAGGGYICRFNK